MPANSVPEAPAKPEESSSEPASPPETPASAEALAKPRWRKLLDDGLHKLTWKGVATDLLVLALLVYVYREVTRDVVVLQPISVPKRFEEVGLTPEVMTNRVGEALRQMELVTRTRMKKDTLASVSEIGKPPEIEIPGTKLGLGTIIDATRSIFGRYPEMISGDIVGPLPVTPAKDDSPDVAGSMEPASSSATNQAGAASTKPVKASAAKPAGENAAKSGGAGSSSLEAGEGKQTVVTIYVMHGRKRTSASGVVPGAGDDGDALVQRAAELVLEQVNPYLYASYEMDHGQLEKAAEVYGKVVGDPDEDEGHREVSLIGWGLVNVRQGRLSEAIAKYQKALELNPKSALAYADWGLALNAEYKLDEAIAKFQQAVQLDPRIGFVYAYWGWSLEQKKLFDQAAAKYQEASRVDPDDPESYVLWGEMLEKQGKPDEAIAKYQQAMQADPEDASGFDAMGTLLERQKKYSEAIAMYRLATNGKLGSEPAYMHWGDILARQGDYNGAIGKYRKVIELEPASPDAYTKWGIALFNMKRFPEAIVEFQKAIEVDPNFAAAYANWALAAAAQRNFLGAVGLQQKAITLGYVPGQNP